MKRGCGGASGCKPISEPETALEPSAWRQPDDMCRSWPAVYPSAFKAAAEEFRSVDRTGWLVGYLAELTYYWCHEKANARGLRG